MEKTPKEIAHNLPNNPGVYMMIDQQNKVIYVGKAKNLRKRVSQYFLPNRDLKTSALVNKICKIDHIITGNDYEALVLENNLIKKYNPHYNILLKDGKSYPVIRITHEDFPKVFKTRRIIKDGSLYFGPFPEINKLNQYLGLIEDLFMLRKCSIPLRKKKQPCLYYHIGKCSAPCCGRVSKEEYNKNISKIKKILSGNILELENQIKSEMLLASENQDYETAVKKRDLLFSLQDISKPQMVEEFNKKGGNKDYAAIEMRNPLCTVSIMQFREGKLIGKALYRASTLGDESETLSSFLLQYYDESLQLPSELYVSHEIDSDLISKYFKEYLNGNINVFTPTDGKDFRILRMALENAKEDVEKRLKSRDNTEALQTLMDICSLEKLPTLIEGFDIAQLHGKYTVASLISFTDGNPNPSGYRRFNIKSLDGKIDDYQSIREAVYRRYTRVLAENLKIPDLIMIDGGKGQVNVAREVLDSIGLATTPVVGLAKEYETIVFDDDRADLVLDHSNEGLRLLIAVRDECHRFATSANQAMRSKDVSFKLLESVSGIGKKRSQKIMEVFSSLDELLNLPDEEIVSKTGISAKIIEQLRKRLS